ncbi:hypothetical protein [Actinomadura latina]|uniref:Uncharacterized protein n=1 Tax=Actinomadura latina TaxID=163603 RepID=A0A846Z338_9ACTN|nr:hypothetical protein [Actinomadura latina]NKZ07349.1 hypothetical protein [Actinomadura latina]
MTGERAPGRWRREELRHSRPGFRIPWLALAGVAATIIAATTLVAGIGDSLSSRDRSAGRLLPLQAASPPPAAAPGRVAPGPDTPAAELPPAGDAEPPETSASPESRIHAALLRLRSSVYQGVAIGDVRDDVGLDLTNVIEGMLGRQWSPLDRRRADVAYLQHKISTRTREGAITSGRAEQLHLILDRATGG